MSAYRMVAESQAQAAKRRSRSSRTAVAESWENYRDWHQIKVISERLGHASIAITLDTYAHVLPVADERTAHTLASHILGHQ